MGKIVITTFGSLGDLHPSMALAERLQERGHDVVLATSPAYRPNVEGAGLRFHPVRPDLPDVVADPRQMAHYLDLKKGPERVIREFMAPQLKQSYEDLYQAAHGADLIISNTLTYAARLVAEQKRIKWLSLVLMPMGFYSRFDPPILAPAPWLDRLSIFGPTAYEALFRYLKWTTRDWLRPWHELRAGLGLEPDAKNPIFEGQYSPHGTLALFSDVIARPQPDWPANTSVTGFVRFKSKTNLAEEQSLKRFLDEGPSPLVFTRGSAVVFDAEEFFATSVRVAEKLGERAIITVGKSKARARQLPEGVLAVEYAPYDEIFPRAKIVVHQCGIGTCAEALRAGRPQLLVPHAFDQPDNARRLARLGVGLTLGRGQYSERNVTEALGRLLHERDYERSALEIAGKLRGVDGSLNAALAVEQVLNQCGA